MNKRTPLLMIFASLALHADPVAVNWSGNPVIVSALSNTPDVIEPIPAASQDGPDADLGIVYNEQSIGGFYYPPDIPPQPTNSMSSVIDTQFTIASPADITLALTLSMQDSGSSCGDGDCPQNLTSWTFAGAFSGSLAILGPGGIDLSVPFGAAGSVAANCGIFPSDCGADLSLSDTESGTVDLAAGTYTLQATFNSWTNTVGDGSAGGQLCAVVSDPVAGGVAVPEPGMLLLPLLGLLVGSLAWRRVRVYER